MTRSDTCKNFLASISEYMDGELDPELCAELDRHLAGCDDCQVMVDTLRKTIYLVHAASDSCDCPEDVRQRLFHKLDLDEFLNNSSSG